MLRVRMQSLASTGIRIVVHDRLVRLKDQAASAPTRLLSLVSTHGNTCWNTIMDRTGRDASASHTSHHTSSKMYIGAGRNSSRDKISDRVKRDRCPPLSSDRLCFQTPPNATRTSRPSKKLQPSGGSSLASVPGRRVAKILLKLTLTLCHVSSSCSSRLMSTCSMTYNCNHT